MRVADRLRVPASSQRVIARTLEFALIGFLFVGLYQGELGIVVNSGVALAVAQLPAALERNYGIVMDPRLVLWLTAAVFLHALGTVGLPGTETFYRSVWWWDHLTHTLSASVVAATGYVVVRSLDEHVPAVYFPPSFTFVAILVVVIAFGVFWEVIEFAIGLLAQATGMRSVLTQYGLQDSMLDLVFDILGGLIVATWGTVYLTDVISQLTDRLEGRIREPR